MKTKVNLSKLFTVCLLAVLLFVSGLPLLLNTNAKDNNTVFAVTDSDWYEDYPGQAPKNGTCGEDVTWQWDVVDGQGVLTIGGTGTTISNTDGWQGNTSLIHKVIIGDNITTINANPWTWATMEVKLGSNLVSLTGFTFMNCQSLTTVKCSSNDPDGVITLPSGVTEIGDNFFLGCENITFVKLNNNITSIGKYAFSACVRLTTIKCAATDPNGVATLPSSMTEISENLFGSGYNENLDRFVTPCTSLVSVRLNNNITKIGDFAFAGCQSLTTIKCAATDPNGIATLPEELEYIGINAFGSEMSYDGCAMSAVNFSSNVTYIGYNCFIDCTNLSRVNGGKTNGLCVIPASVEFIGGYAFFGCDDITDVVIEGNNLQLDDWGDLPFFINNDCWDQDNELLLCQSGNYHIYIPNEQYYSSYQSNAQTYAEEDEDKSWVSWAKYFGENGLVVNGSPNGYPVDSSSGGEQTGVLVNIILPSSCLALLIFALVMYVFSFRRKRHI